MLTEYDSMPVELFRDGRGVYGIGVSERVRTKHGQNYQR
jgi:hypothetical protein